MLHKLLIIAMAFIVPLAGITAFILIDKGITALANYFSRRRKPKIDVDSVNKKLDLVQIERPSAQTAESPASSANPANSEIKPGCKKCAGCKLAATGGCRRKNKV